MKNLKIVLSLFFVTTLVVGCKSTSAPIVATLDCKTPVSKNVEQAFITAKDSLSKRECWGSFDAQFDALLEAAKGDPSPQIKKNFAEFLRWNEESGIISNQQLKETYTRFFTPYFVSLPKDQSNCKAGQELSPLTLKMDKEMLDKKRGILEALNDKAGYDKAKNDRDALLLVIAAAGQACQV